MTSRSSSPLGMVLRSICSDGKNSGVGPVRSRPSASSARRVAACRPSTGGVSPVGQPATCTPVWRAGGLPRGYPRSRSACTVLSVASPPIRIPLAAFPVPTEALPLSSSQAAPPSAQRSKAPIFSRKIHSPAGIRGRKNFTYSTSLHSRKPAVRHSSSRTVIVRSNIPCLCSWRNTRLRLLIQALTLSAARKSSPVPIGPDSIMMS